MARDGAQTSWHLLGEQMSPLSPSSTRSIDAPRWAPLEFPKFKQSLGGRASEIASGLHLFRLPLPFRLNHVNTWLIESDDGWSIVDCGVSDAHTQTVWTGALSDKHPKQVIVTHHHPDHIGSAGWICQNWKVPLIMSRTEWLAAHFSTALAQADPADRNLSFYTKAACPDSVVEYVRNDNFSYTDHVYPLPPSFNCVADGDVMSIGGRQWTVIPVGGHSPEMICLFCSDENILIAADQLLPRITPNIAVQPEDPEARPIGEFLKGLRRLRELPAETLVLPSHGEPFYGIHARIDDLVAHHERRLSFLLDSAAEPVTASTLSKILFPDALQQPDELFAFWETIAHLRHLEAEGLLKRRVDKDQIEKYRRCT